MLNNQAYTSYTTEYKYVIGCDYLENLMKQLVPKEKFGRT